MLTTVPWSGARTGERALRRLLFGRGGGAARDRLLLAVGEDGQRIGGIDTDTGETAFFGCRRSWRRGGYGRGGCEGGSSLDEGCRVVIDEAGVHLGGDDFGGGEDGAEERNIRLQPLDAELGEGAGGLGDGAGEVARSAWAMTLARRES